MFYNGEYVSTRDTIVKSSQSIEITNPLITPICHIQAQLDYSSSYSQTQASRHDASRGSNSRSSAWVAIAQYSLHNS